MASLLVATVQGSKAAHVFASRAGVTLHAPDDAVFSPEQARNLARALEHGADLSADLRRPSFPELDAREIARMLVSCEPGDRVRARVPLSYASGETIAPGTTGVIVCMGDAPAIALVRWVGVAFALWTSTAALERAD